MKNLLKNNLIKNYMILVVFFSLLEISFRLISGISDKILITEASKKSGTMITANFAIEQGKTVYAVPGNITSTRSEGTNELIKDGAILVNSLEDITDL